MADLDLDRVFAFPISKHIGADKAVNGDCNRHMRAMNRRIVLLATSRSGSEYLSDLLQKNFGIEAHEYLNPRSSVSRGHAIAEGQSPSEFLSALSQRLPNRIFCTKANMHALMPLFEIGEFPTHIREWHFIHLSRTNVIRQAISLLLAEKTGAWRDDMEPTDPIDLDELTYAAIASRIEQVLAARDWLDRFLALFEITPLRINYEDLRASPRDGLERIGRFLELPNLSHDLGAAPASNAGPRQQSTQLNQHLEAAFRTEMQHRLSTGRASRELLISEQEAAAMSTVPGRPRRSAPRPNGPVRIECAGGFEGEIGFCWLYRLRKRADADTFARFADSDQARANSPLLVYENGAPLGPAHASHAIIRNTGSGAYSHWKDDLYFSTSDNSDPNLNGRRYEIALGPGG
ncbi:MAG: Stf0 family sulfotransferase [Reyranella sp.]|nr:Stf0 family sulfotransferase [Reyranella sp.]